MGKSSSCTCTVSEGLLPPPRHIGRNFYYGACHGPPDPRISVTKPCLLIMNKRSLSQCKTYSMWGLMRCCACPDLEEYVQKRRSEGAQWTWSTLRYNPSLL